MLHCLRRIAGNRSGHPEEFCEIVFIASMMSSLLILMSDSVFACGCPKKSLGYLIVIVGSGVLKTLLHCSFSSSLIFFAWFQVPLFILERSNSSSDGSVVFYEFVEVFWVFLDSSNSSRFS